jgi:hypothetical protein
MQLEILSKKLTIINGLKLWLQLQSIAEHKQEW